MYANDGYWELGPRECLSRLATVPVDDVLDTAWVDDAVLDLGSRWGQYEHVTDIGSAA
ncbi:hypothetical protein [Streptomyces sp. NPDC101237]|uniref:hypothetical protein n=1 Tax=Streptomyces sp. NPDC101237 TaxID=3366139 RepID=UPI00380024A7